MFNMKLDSELHLIQGTDNKLVHNIYCDMRREGTN